MIELVLGFAISLVSLLIGFSLGRFEKPLPPKLQQQLQEVFKRRVADPLINPSGVGAVPRPTQEQLDRYKNPQLAQEEQIMTQTFTELNKQ